ncbi:asparaginase [Luteipulveratus flavus]|uniref:Asparaginase n=1 Tax=Luteipulveratus flavus TaxID=3031728 RepID=A0ABT6C9L2_9MICO|nr:asparaginase [Luteipulveratus sp. YIM 133296]MDF8265553.1 asparaginase [Luteipulveratus sp. YIM 133296]
MTDPNPLAAAPVLAHVVRSGFVESVHHVVAVEVAADGSVTRAYGDVTAPMMPRSSNKPMQAVAMLRAGADLDGELLALASASHSGEAFHIEGVRRILADAGLAEQDLQNTPDLPLDERARQVWLQEGRPKRPIAQNCSGKHAAMLAACAAAGWDLETYRDPQHPLQRLMAETIGELAGEPVAATGVDGCGAPVMAIGLAGLARSFGRIAAAPAGGPEARVRDAIRAYPEYLGGTRRDVTALIRGVDGLIAKDGAEAVYAAGLADGRGFAVKVTDGSQRARTPVMAALLRTAGVDAPVLDEVGHVAVLGHGEPVGSVEVHGL